MEFNNKEHEELHDLLIKLGFELDNDGSNPDNWGHYDYYYSSSIYGDIYFNDFYVDSDSNDSNDYVIESEHKFNGEYLDCMKLDKVIDTLKDLLAIENKSATVQKSIIEETQMKFKNELHEELHKTLISCGFNRVEDYYWEHYYILYPDNKDYKIYFDKVSDLSVYSNFKIRGESYAEYFTVNQLIASLKEIFLHVEYIKSDSASVHIGNITQENIQYALLAHPNYSYHDYDNRYFFDSINTKVKLNKSSPMHKYGIYNTDSGRATNSFDQFLDDLLVYGIQLTEPNTFANKLKAIKANGVEITDKHVKSDSAHTLEFCTSNKKLYINQSIFTLQESDDVVEAVKGLISAIDNLDKVNENVKEED